MVFRSWWARVGLAAAAYFIAGKVALVMAIPPGYAAAVWPAAGIALLATLRWEWAALAGTFLGSFAVNVSTGDPPVAVALGVGASLQAWAGARLIRRETGASMALETGRDVANVFLLGGALACTIAATWGVAVLYVVGAVSANDVAFHWFTWWVGDTIGVSIAVPILLAAVGEPRSVWRTRILTVAVPVAVASAGVVVAFIVASHTQTDKAQTELAGRASVIAHAIQQRAEHEADIVAAAASFVAAHPDVTVEQLGVFVDGAFGRSHDLANVAWCPRVTRETRAAFEAAVAPIRSFGPNRTVAPAPDLDEMFPVRFIVPSSPNIGIDVGSEILRAGAIKRATQTGRPVATRPLQLLRGADGFAIFAPVRTPDHHLLGVTVTGFDSAIFLRSATDRLDTSGVRIAIVDIGDNPATPLVGDPAVRAEWSRDVDVVGRMWRINVSRSVPPLRNWQAWFVLAGGLAFVGLLGSMLLTITGARARVVAAERRYRDLYENAPDMYFTVVLGRGQIRDCNAVAARELGYEPEDLVGKLLADLAEPQSRMIIDHALITLVANGMASVSHLVVQRRDQQWLDVSLSASAIYEGSEVVAARVLLRDVSEIVEAERDHRFQVELGDALDASGSLDAVMARAAARISDYLGLDKCYVAEVEAETQRITIRSYTRGRPDPEQLPTSSLFETVGLDELLRGQRNVIADVATDSRTASLYEQAYAPRDVGAFIAVPLMRGQTCVAYFKAVSSTPRDWRPREIALVQSVAERSWLWSEHLRSVHELRDLSRYLEQRVEERTQDLVAAVSEKDALIKEIHHRVKNNLQVISSMLNLQARRLKDSTLAAAFEESQQRIQTIALVHEQLYQSHDLANIGFDKYLESLVANVMYAQNAAQRGITATTNIAGVNLPIQRAIPCGLIVNELITNAVKHAFPGGRSGTIKVSMLPKGEQVELAISDDGVGLPADLDPAKLDSLGLDLVYAFAEQLDAKLDIRTENGASFTLRFSPS